MKHLVKSNLRTHVLASIAAMSLSCASMQALAIGTEEDQNQAPLASEFKKLDLNSDQKLTREEGARDKDIVGNFERADTNKDGLLAEDEYSGFKSGVQQKRVEVFLDDSTVTAKVKAELIKDTGMKGLSISVETHKGQVILSGFVENDQQVRRAIQIASGVRGVQSVKSGLVIKG